MVYIQIELNEDQNKKVAIYRVKLGLGSKAEAIASIIDNYKEVC